MGGGFSSVAGVAQHTADAGTADAVGRGDLGDAHPVLAVALDRGAIDGKWRAADAAAFDLGPAQAGWFKRACAHTARASRFAGSRSIGRTGSFVRTRT